MLVQNKPGHISFKFGSGETACIGADFAHSETGLVIFMSLGFKLLEQKLGFQLYLCVEEGSDNQHLFGHDADQLLGHHHHCRLDILLEKGLDQPLFMLLQTVLICGGCRHGRE